MLKLTAVLKDEKIATVWGSLKSLIDIKSPTLLGAVAVIAGQTSVPLHIAIPGLAVARAIEVANYWTGRRTERRAKLRESPFAYLYHAHEAKLLE